jgi:hypothetical protein
MKYGAIPTNLFERLASATYHADEYSAWRRDAGFGAVKVVRPALSPGNVLVTARWRKGREENGPERT